MLAVVDDRSTKVMIGVAYGLAVDLVAKHRS